MNSQTMCTGVKRNPAKLCNARPRQVTPVSEKRDCVEIDGQFRRHDKPFAEFLSILEDSHVTAHGGFQVEGHVSIRQILSRFQYPTRSKGPIGKTKPWQEFDRFA